MGVCKEHWNGYEEYPIRKFLVVLEIVYVVHCILMYRFNQSEYILMNIHCVFDLGLNNSQKVKFDK